MVLSFPFHGDRCAFAAVVVSPCLLDGAEPSPTQALLSFALGRRGAIGVVFGFGNACRFYQRTQHPLAKWVTTTGRCGLLASRSPRHERLLDLLRQRRQ